ncbi:autotransporter domain-containing protein, partial [Phascolarctobacterium succinatutens]|uniref:autotransporter domain-containing protein n=1 Tax=Phascolarctobacterium succinatutens TaxID=626940 RepID=UPI00402A5138
NTVDNNIYNFTKDATTITTDSSAITTAKDTTLKLNNHDLTITANGGDGIATTGGMLTVQDAGNLTVKGAKAINANNSKVEITAVNVTLNGDVSTNNVVNIKATKSAKVNGTVNANGANSSVSINGTASAAISGAVSADGANAAVTIDSADTIIGSDITANGKGAKVTAKNLSKLDGDVTTDADGSVELNFKEGASWTGDNSGNTAMSLSKGTWNGANTGKLNATLTNGTSWTGDSSGARSTIKLDASSWSGMNSGANANVTLTNGASWSKGNTADGVTVKADKAAWTGANGGANANITLGNASTWTGANNGANATVNLTDSSWSGDNSGAGLSLTADNSKWNGSTNTAGSATLTNGSIWNGASTSADFSLTLNGSTWNNSGASSLKSFTGTNGVVDMTNAAASVTIGSYSGDATVIYKHNSSNPAEVHGGNFTVTSAKSGSKITMLTDNTGVDTTDEDKINEALDALAGKLFYTGAIGGAENNLNGTVKIAEGLTATSVAKQTAGIVYDKTTGQGSADHKTVTPGPVYPTEQDRTAFVTSITGEHLTDKEYRKAGVLSNTVDNNIYNFTKDATTITTDSSAITTAKDTTLKLNNNDLTITANSGDGIATTGGTLTVQDAGNLTVKGAKAINANNSKVDITAVNATLNGDVSTNNVVNIKATKAAKVNGAVSANGANAAVTIDSADTTIGSDITANGKGAKVTAKNLSKLDGDVTTDADGSVELNFKEGASWSGDNSGNTTMSLSKGTWNGANTGKLNATLTNGTTWTGDSSGAGSTIKLDASSWSGMNSGANANVTLTNGASWTKGNTADDVTVKADKAAWTGANGGAKANITLSNSASWTGTNTGSNATVNLTDSSWTGDNSGAGLSLTANNSKWNGNANAAGSATLTNGSSWTGASTSADFALTLNGSTWNNSGTSSLKSFTGTNGIVDMTNAAASVTIGSYSGDATVIYKHNSNNPGEVYGGNFTVTKAAANSKITMLTDRSGVDFSDEDSIANALNSLANKLYYTGYITGERNLTGYVKLAEGLTASSVVKQTGDIAYDKTTGQGSLKDGSVTPNVTYPEAQTKDNFTSQITGEWKQDKEYKLAGVLHTDNAVYDFSKDSSIIATAGTSVGAGRDLQLQLNNKSMSLNSGADAVQADAITIEFKNLDKLDIKAAGQALLAENGGKIILHNTGAVTADSAFVANGAGSGIKADGLTNITVGSGDAVKADAGSIELAGGTVKGDVTADNKGKISINANNNAAGSTLTDITGNVLAESGSSVDIGLGTADSKLTGDVSTVGDAVINIYADMGVWTGNADGDNVNLNLNSNKAQWNNIGNSKLRSLKGNGGIINQTDANAGNIDVGNYSGNIVVNYKHTADKDTAANTLNNIQFGGGTLNIDKAAEGSSIILRTDNSDNLSYTETDNIEKLFRELSKKLYYADAGSNPNNLSGHVEIAEGLTKVKVYGDINYGEHGQGNYKDGSIKRTDPEIIYGSSETAMMRGAKSAMASTALLWRSENSDMLQRMGDVRLANEESGLWARYYGGKNSFDAKNTKYSTSFNAYQLGYDKQLDNNMLFGAAVSYNKGKNTYEMGGHGDGKAVSLSVYGSWNSDKGHYADVIVKGGKLDNDYTVYNDMGHKLEGDYDTWGLSLSAEYGRRMQMQNGFYIDPSVQFTVGRVAGADYSAASDFLDSKGLKKDMYVSQDAFTSAIGRIGLGIGKTTDKSMFYTKFALAHEFSGDFTTTFAAENEPTSSTAVDFGGTWFEWQLGGSMKVNDNSYVYATFEKKFGGDTGSNDWRLDAGLRWSF